MITTFTYSDYTEKSVDPKGNEVVKHYDKTGRLSSIEGEVTYTYNLDGTVKKLVYQNGTTEEYFYNEDQTLKKLLNTYHDHKDEFIYEYDNNKNIVFKNEKGKESIYTYDELNQLKTIGEITYEEIGNEELERVETLLTTYLYDKNGNRIKEISLDNTKEYIYDSNNRLIKVVEKENNITKKTTFYTYDKNGNELTKTENGVLKVTNTYNDKNELVKTVVDSKETNYVYNAEGKRIEKRGEKTIKYVYEGLDVILELDENDNEIGHNVYGLALVSRNNSSKGYYLYNGHGDTVTIVDLEEKVLNNYTYDEWGVIIESDGEFNNPYRYAGYYYDSETDNYYLLSRYYNPEIGRFISEDSYRGDYNDPLSLNRYVYVTNNPLIYVDPEGHSAKEVTDWLWLRIKGAGAATFEFAYDATVGTIDLVGTTTSYIVSELGKTTNDFAYSMGIITDQNYVETMRIYDNLNSTTSEKLAQLPENMVNGIRDNFATTFNYDNFINYLTTDNYSEIKDYSKSVIQTGTTIYGGYKLATGVNSLVASVSNASITMNPIPIGSVVNANGTLSMITVPVPSITGVNTAAINQALINGSIGTAAISTNGNDSGKENFNKDYFAPNKQPKNPKLVDSKYLKKHGINEHQFKEDLLRGKNINRSNYNIYVDRDGSLWLLKNGTNNYIPTYDNINWSR